MLTKGEVTDRFIPFYGHAGAVDVGGSTVLKILEPGIARFLSVLATVTQPAGMVIPEHSLLGNQDERSHECNSRRQQVSST